MSSAGCFRLTFTHSKFMNQPRRFAGVTGIALMLLLGGRAVAQPPGFGGGAGFPNIDPQQMQAMRDQVLNMDPQQLQEMVQQFQSMNPQDMQATLQQFMTMDPQQIQKTLDERTAASLRAELAVSDDTEWAALQEKIQAVTKARAAVAADLGGTVALGGLRGGLAGGRNGGRLLATGRLSPEAKALQAALEADAPSAEIKELMARLREAREAKRATLVKAQETLRSALTFRQQTIAVVRGLLD
jgi:hypothetical protein